MRSPASFWDAESRVFLCFLLLGFATIFDCIPTGGLLADERERLHINAFCESGGELFRFETDGKSLGLHRFDFRAPGQSTVVLQVATIQTGVRTNLGELKVKLRDDTNLGSIYVTLPSVTGFSSPCEGVLAIATCAYRRQIELAIGHPGGQFVWLGQRVAKDTMLNVGDEQTILVSYWVTQEMRDHISANDGSNVIPAWPFDDMTINGITEKSKSLDKSLAFVVTVRYD